MQLIKGRLLQLAAIEWGKYSHLFFRIEAKTKTLLSAIWEKGLLIGDIP